MKLMIFCLLTSFQIDTLPSADSLEMSIINYYKLEAAAQVQEFEVLEKYSFIKYVPSVSFGYSLGTDKNGNLTNQLRPSVGFNLMNIYNYFNKRQINKSKINSIILQNENQLNNDLLILENALEKLKIKRQELKQKIENLTTEKEIYLIEKQIFTISENEYKVKNQTEILPSQFLAIKKSFLTATKSYNQKVYEIQELKREIERMELDILLIAKCKKRIELN